MCTEGFVTLIMKAGSYETATRRHIALHCHHCGSHQHRMKYRYLTTKYKTDILTREGYYEDLQTGFAGLSIKRSGREPNYKSATWNNEEIEDNIKIVFTEFVRMGN